MIQSLIFGFGHRARHGKDTVASEIIKHFGSEFDIRRYAFGQELKHEVNANALRSGGMRNLFNEGLRLPGCGYMQTNENIIALPDWVQYDPDAPMDDPDCPLGKQRTLLQFWGTEFRRNVDQNYWVDKLAKHIEKDNPQIALVTDLRFPNEIAWVREYGDVIKVHRTGYDSGVLPHASEVALAHLQDHEWDAVIYNDAGLEELSKQALYVFEELMEKVRA